MKRKDGMTHPCWKPTPIWNDFDCLPFTQTQTSGWQSTDAQSMPYSRSTLQSLSRGTRSFAFSRSTKHAKMSFANSQDFWKVCLRVKFWSVVLRPGRKPHWPFSNFDSTISRYFFSRHFAHTFPGRLRSDNSQYFVHSLQSLFLYLEMITHVCQSFGVFSSFQATWHTLVNHLLLLSSMSSTFQVEFHLHQQPFRISILVWLLPLLLVWRLPLSQN